MSATTNTVPVISLSEDFGTLVVQGSNIKVEIFADGNVNVQTAGRVTTTGPSMATAASAEALKIGAARPDGSVYAGVSPDTGRPMYATPKDAPLTCTFNEAGKYASQLDAHGHKDWRVPTKAELNVLFGNRVAIGGFDETGHVNRGWYWSSSRDGYDDFAWARRFSDGNQYCHFRGVASALRCVRG